MHVTHVWRDLRTATLPAASTDEYLWAYEREAGEFLEEQAEHLRSAGGTVAGAHLRKGRPADEIAGLAEELGADLVVIGSRGLGMVKRLVMGSVSEGVVSLAPCPILVMRGGEGAWPPGRLIVGDDFSSEAKRAGELAAAMGRLFEARVLLVWAYPATMVRARRAPNVRRAEELLRRNDESLQERAAELEDVLGTLPETKVVTADPAAAIQEEDGEGTLVAVGRRGLNAVKRFALGSVSTGVLRSVRGPVLIIPLAGESRNGRERS